jgi:hypothetical protein
MIAEQQLAAKTAPSMWQRLAEQARLVGAPAPASRRPARDPRSATLRAATLRARTAPR